MPTIGQSPFPLFEFEERPKFQSVMGWKGKVVNKLGSFLSASLEVPLSHLYGFTADRGNIHDPSQELQHRSNSNLERATTSTDEYGPDTSSLTAFLLSLLSSSDASHPRSRDNPEASEQTLHSGVSASTSGTWEVEASNETPLCDASASPPSTWEPLIEKDQAGNIQYEGFPCDNLQGLRHYLQNEDSSMALLTDSSVKSQSYLTPLQESLSAVIKLPPLSEDSILLPESFRASINAALPTLVKDRRWVMLYTTAKHGISLRTLYRKSGALPAPFLLVAGDFHGVTFGGLITAPLIPTTKRKYQGTNDMFVFSNVRGKPQIFRATGANRYYILCMTEGISFGGGGHFALHLDEDLLNGSSGPCDTFGNDCLASSEEFSVANVEVWGFAHMSRYASNQA